MGLETDTSQPPAPVVVQVDKQSQPWRKRLIITVAAVLALGLFIGAAMYYQQKAAETRAAEQAAVKRSQTKAKGFAADSTSYSFVQLNTAVTFAKEGKCSESQAIYDEVKKDPKGLSDVDMNAFKTRIDKLCSGKQ